MIEQQLKDAIRDVPDFPKPGVVFKDITPILQDPKLCGDTLDALVQHHNPTTIDAIVGIESRGFLFGLLLAQRLGKPFVPIRKRGKLPYRTVRQDYELEYGSACVEIHEDAFTPGARVLIHDDLLATGGTMVAASQLVQKLGGEIAGYTFIISLDFLHGRNRLNSFSRNISTLISY